MGEQSNQSPGGSTAAQRFFADTRIISLRGPHGGPLEWLQITYVPRANPGPTEHIQAKVGIPGHDHVRATAFFDVRGGSRVLTQVIVGERDIAVDGTANTARSPVTPSTVAALAKVLDRANRQIAIAAGPVDRLDWTSAQLAEALGMVSRSKLTNRDYAMVAIVYDGAECKKRKAVEEKWFVGQSRASEMIREARRRGLLTKPPRRGVEGGRATDRAWKIVGPEIPAHLRAEIEARHK